MNSFRSNNISLKYQRFTTLGSRAIGMLSQNIGMLSQNSISFNHNLIFINEALIVQIFKIN